MLTSTIETVYGIWNTVAGGDSTAASLGAGPGNYYYDETPSEIFDNDATTKYVSFGDCSAIATRTTSCGLNTGFYLTLQRGSSLLQGFRIRTPNSVPERDPLTITIEGSNAASSLLTLGSSWTSIYSGVTGLSPDPGRLTWGSYQYFTNPISYKSYRFLVTSKRGSDEAVQFADVEFISIIIRA